METQTFTVKRNGGVDLVFEGVCLVDLHSRMNDEQQFWTEIRIYRTLRGQYVAESVGKNGQGTTPDRRNVTVLDDPSGLAEALKRRVKPPKTPYLTELAVEALEEAGKADHAIAATLVERI